jgi:hypothetical protein
VVMGALGHTEALKRSVGTGAGVALRLLLEAGPTKLNSMRRMTFAAGAASPALSPPTKVWSRCQSAKIS